MRNKEQTILFGKYQIVEEIGVGASGHVYLARHLGLKTYRAIKRVSKSHSLQSQFRLEANLMKSLTHPSIPIIYDIEEDESYIYIIEEYVEGESLQEYLLYHDGISREYIMQLGIRLCDVFAYLHSRKPYPICYKDLKPEHIILCGDTVKIIDFGIASYIDNSGNKPQNKEKMYTEDIGVPVPYGTVGYAAPEQYRGEHLVPATDLYAIGKVLMQLEKHAPDTSGNLKRIIRKATAEEVHSRYASAMELKQELEQEYNRVCSNGKGNKHLYSHIAVVGAKSGIGTTHLAIAVTTYFNRLGRSCIYQSKKGVDTVELLIRSHYISEKANGIYGGGYFQGMLMGNEVSQKRWDEPENEIHVMDFGSHMSECLAEEAECTILVLGGSLWEQECSYRAIEKYRHVPNLIIICNYNHRQICRKYAEMAGKKVYCYPFDENPWRMTKAKMKLFKKILHRKKERRNGIFFPKRRGWNKEPSG